MRVVCMWGRGWEQSISVCFRLDGKFGLKTQRRNARAREIEMERELEKKRYKDREFGKKRKRSRGRERVREVEREFERESSRERVRERERERVREREFERERERERVGEKKRDKRRAIEEEKRAVTGQTAMTTAPVLKVVTGLTAGWVWNQEHMCVFTS